MISAPAELDRISWYENDGAATPGFSIHLVTTAVNSPRSVAAADLDGDGDTDLLSASAFDAKIAWYESDGGTTPAYTARSISTSAAGAQSVHAADIDGDGDIDVLGAALGGDRISWYENDGEVPPSFATHSISSSAAGAVSIFASDVDGDGDIDVLAALQGEDEIVWYESDGASPPAFVERIVSNSAAGTQTVFATDVDRDGDVDLLAASQDDDTIAWFENDGAVDPAFTERLISESADQARSVSAADLDGDGDVDLLSASQGDDTIAWHENDSIHRDAVFPEATPLATSGADWAMPSADVDGDGDVDLFTVSRNAPGVAWHENDGGSPPAFSMHVIATDPIGGATARAADLDGDGDPDLVSTSPEEGLVVWYENDVARGGPWVVHSLAPPQTPQVAVTADLDRDGDIDILYSTNSPQYEWTAEWYESDGGAPPSFSRHLIATLDVAPFAIATGDMDGDGDIDVVTDGGGFNGTLTLYESDGGSPPGFTAQLIDDLGGYALQNVIVGDVDRDGDLDVVAGLISDQILWYENDGSPAPSFTKRTIEQEFNEIPSGLFLGDLDGDGDLDLLTGETSEVWWYENDGGAPPSFGSGEFVAYNDLPWAISAADLDRDGDLDVLSPSAFDGDDFGTTSWLENEGGQFSLVTGGDPGEFLLEGTVHELFAVDLAHGGRAGDNDLELATLELLFEESPGDPLSTAEANALIDGLTVYLDDGSGVLEPGPDYVVASLATLALGAGRQTVTMIDGDSLFQVAPEATKRFFVVAALTADAASQTPDSWIVTHLARSGSLVEDRDHDLVLAAGVAPDVSSGPLTAVSAAGAGAVPDGEHVTGMQMTVALEDDGKITLSWAASCSPSDDDYAVYEGTVGALESQVPVVCSTDGATSHTFEPESGNRYYLVVPHNGLVEGSYGRWSDGFERSHGPEICRDPSIAGCF